MLILTTFDLDEYVFEALRAGASGFLLKDTLPDDLLAAVRVVAEGDALLAPKVTRRLIEQFVAATGRGARSRRIPRSTTLTDREREVLAAVARGLSNAEIGEQLFMSHATAKTHVSRLLTKLVRARSRPARVLAYEVRRGHAGRRQADVPRRRTSPDGRRRSAATRSREARAGATVRAAAPRTCRRSGSSTRG